LLETPQEDDLFPNNLFWQYNGKSRPFSVTHCARWGKDRKSYNGFRHEFPIRIS